MTRGHPDYNPAVFPHMPTLGPGQTLWYRAAESAIAGGGTLRQIDYTTTAGYELYVTGAIISSNSSYIHAVELVYGDAYALSFVGKVYYDTNFVMPITGYNRLVVPADQSVGMLCYNDDNQNHGFSVCLIGFLQEKE